MQLKYIGLSIIAQTSKIKSMNTKYNLIIGSHVSLSAPDFFLNSVREALSYKANALMIYTGAPQNVLRKDVEAMKIEEAFKLMKENNFDSKNIIVHAPYIVNPANAQDPEKYQFTINFLKKELERTKKIGGHILVMHPGSHVGLGDEIGIANCINTINKVLDQDSSVKIAIETMAGKGGEICYRFQQVRQVIDGVNENIRHLVGVCLDSCHIHDAGYDIINNLDKVIDEFDSVVGVDKLLCIHLNDSKNPQGARKDRHENIGKGYIGENTLLRFVWHPKLNNVPKILETPYIDNKPPYAEEIAYIRNNNPY